MVPSPAIAQTRNVLGSIGWHQGLLGSAFWVIGLKPRVLPLGSQENIPWGMYQCVCHEGTADAGMSNGGDCQGRSSFACLPLTCS